MLRVATETQETTCCVTCYLFMSFTKNRSVRKIILLSFLLEINPALYSTRMTLILLCSPHGLYTLLKAVAWKKVIRLMTTAAQGNITVVIYRMVEYYLVTAARRCQEN